MDETNVAVAEAPAAEAAPAPAKRTRSARSIPCPECKAAGVKRLFKGNAALGSHRHRTHKGKAVVAVGTKVEQAVKELAEVVEFLTSYAKLSPATRSLIREHLN